jgi:cold shock CspA family protein
MREIGIVKWFGARDRRENVYGFIHNIEKDEDIYVGFQDIECESEMLKEGVVVSYQEKQQRQTNKKRAIQVRLIADETDSDVLQRCFQSQEVQIWLAVSSRYINSLSINTAIEKIEKKAEAVRDIYYRKRLIESIPDTVIYSLLAGNLRKLLLPEKKRLDILARLILENEIDLLKKYDIESEVEELLGSLDNFHADIFFNQVKNVIIYNGFMWHLATENIKKDVMRNHFQNFFHFIDTYTNKVIELLETKKNTIQFECSSIYQELDKEDWQLGELWAKSESSANKEFIIAKMISARGAEKVAQIFFKILGFKSVKDVAILQLSNNEEDWRICDIIIDNQFFVDVKNTRTSRNNRGVLSEICVPKFKRDRNNNEVVILGIVSPYLKLSEIKGSDSTSRHPKKITVIGQVTQSTIYELKQQYESSFLQITISALSKETYLPAWIFDYSTDFYKPFDDFRKSISSSFVEIPSLEEIKMLHYDQPLSIMIQFDINLPIQWKSSLHIWEQEFYDRLLMRKTIKRK